MEENRLIRGISIPKECGYAEGYELIGILHVDELDTTTGKKMYRVYITHDDYERGISYVILECNMHPRIIMCPDDANSGIGILEYDLIELDRVQQQDDMSCLIIEDIVNKSDACWIYADGLSVDYRMIKPKVVVERDNVVSVKM